MSSMIYSKIKEFEYIRSSLIPGILKSIEGNKTNQLPFKIFEISDLVLFDKRNEVYASNKRKLCFSYTNTSSAKQIIQGIIDLLMKIIGLIYNYQENINKTYIIKFKKFL